jgi:hypothetical protein
LTTVANITYTYKKQFILNLIKFNLGKSLLFTFVASVEATDAFAILFDAWIRCTRVVNVFASLASEAIFANTINASKYFLKFFIY